MRTTKQVRESKNKKIIKDISFKDFSAVCQEYQIVEKATRELLELAQDINTSDRTRANIYKWIIEMNIGKPTQMNEINLKGPEDDKKTTGIIMSYTTTREEVEQLEQLKQELLSMGVSEEDIQKRATSTATPDEKSLSKS
jgi:hypothetical protein